LDGVTFRANFLLQEMVSIIYQEGNMEELISVADYHHLSFDSYESCFEWAFNFGEYIGKFFYGQEVWRFSLPEQNGVLYFLGELGQVGNTIRKVL